MKAPYTFAVILSLSTLAASGRIGETKDEATARYGEGRTIDGRKAIGLATLNKMQSAALETLSLQVYTKDNIDIYAVFFTNAAANVVIAEITYRLPPEVKADPSLCAETIATLLEANASGRPWVTNKPSAYISELSRPGATALIHHRRAMLTICDDQYRSSVISPAQAQKTRDAQALRQHLDNF